MFGWGSKNPEKGKGARLIKEFKSLVKSKKYDDALRCGSEYIRKIGDHNHDLFFAMGSIYYMKGRHADAISYLDRALEIGSYDAEALLLKAESHLMLGQDKPAVKCYKKILEVDPKNRDVAEVLRRLGSAGGM